jgi:peptidoglycan/LPS O-acetylase OafA/YrhL
LPDDADDSPSPQQGSAATATHEFALGFRPALEGLRGASVLLILLHHTLTFLVPDLYERGWFEGSFIGVDLFFVLSGFLITSLLLEEHRDTGAIALSAFYLRRAARLLPAVLALLAAMGVYVVVTGLSVTTHARTAVLMLTYGANWFIGRNVELTQGFGAVWSLAIEEQFYLVWPTVLLLILRWSRANLRVLLGVIVVAIVAFASVRSVLFHDSGIWSRTYFRTDARADQLCWGVLLAVLVHAGWVRPKARTLLTATALGVIAVLAWTTSPFTSFYFDAGATLTAAATAVVLLGVLEPTDVIGRTFARLGLRWFGRISYALYLWHVPVFVGVLRYLDDAPTVVRVVIAEVLAIALAWASTTIVEQPFLRLKGRWERARRRAEREAADSGLPGLPA